MTTCHHPIPFNEHEDTDGHIVGYQCSQCGGLWTLHNVPTEIRPPGATVAPPDVLHLIRTSLAIDLGAILGNIEDMPPKARALADQLLASLNDPNQQKETP